MKSESSIPVPDPVTKDKNFDRAKHLDRMAEQFIATAAKIGTGRSRASEIRENKLRIIERLGGSEKDWNSWRWQMRHRVSSTEVLGDLIDLSEAEKREIEEIGHRFRWAISPHFLSLINGNDRECPIRRQVLPSAQELLPGGVPDFTDEDASSPVPGLIRWYPDRVALYLTNACGTLCRHCFRRRMAGERDIATTQEQINEALAYIQSHPGIRDVLVTGGDPLSHDDDSLDDLLTKLDRIEHLDIKRIGTRMPCSIPQRITPELCAMLQRHQPLFVNVQFNHPAEIMTDSIEACRRLADAGIPLGNQSVLLKGVNDNSDVMRLLNQELLRMRVRPYYLYQCEGTEGISHFRTTVEKGLEIVKALRGASSGLAVPLYVVSAPGSLGKTPVSPQYLLSRRDEEVLLFQNWEGRPFVYPNARVENKDR